MRTSLVSVIAGVLTMLPPTQVVAGAFEWGVGLRNGVLVLVVDATNSPTNMIVESASFNVTYIDGANHVLGERNIAIPANEIATGQRKTWSFQQPFPTAKKIAHDDLFTVWHSEGEKADGEELAANQKISSSLPVGAVVPPPASLGNRCDAYGRRAVEQNARNEALSCGYTGSRWDNRPAYHSAWCDDQPESASAAETVARDKLLRSCAKIRILSTVPANR